MSVCVCVLCVSPLFEFDGHGNLQARADARRSRRRVLVRQGHGQAARLRRTAAAAVVAPRDRGGARRTEDKDTGKDKRRGGCRRPPLARRWQSGRHRLHQRHGAVGDGRRHGALSPSAAGAAVAERPPPPPPAPWRRGRRREARPGAMAPCAAVEARPVAGVAGRPGGGGGGGGGAAAAKPPAPCAMTPGAAGRSAAGAGLLTRRRRYGSASVRRLGGLQDSNGFLFKRDFGDKADLRPKKLTALYMLRGCVPSLCSSMLI